MYNPVKLSPTDVRRLTDLLELRLKDLKICTGCWTIQPLDLFYVDLKMEDGHKPQCRSCSRGTSGRPSLGDLRRRVEALQRLLYPAWEQVNA
jgi:hypothetical protein